MTLCTKLTRRGALFVLLGLTLQAAPSAPAAEAPPLKASEFARLVGRLSEEGGYFWNDNYVSNEASYMHPLGRLEELGIRGGIYVGVGPDQNFTYIASLRPRYSFIVDIRRQNLLEHFLFRALFHLARDRRDYLSLLLSRPVRGDLAKRGSYGVEELVAFFRPAEPDTALFDRTQRRVREFLTRATRLRFSDRDFATIEKVHRAFFQRGLSIKYDYVPVPTFGELLLERDLQGRHRNFLNSDANYRHLKRLHEENRIIPVVGDFAGPHTLRELGRYLREQGEKVTVFYTSNVEQYLLRSQSWPAFVRNTMELPLDDCAVFIRSYWGSRLPHPESEPGYRFTQVLQYIRPFLRNLDPAKQHTYFEVVTTDTIRLR